MACRWSSALRHGRKADADPGNPETQGSGQQASISKGWDKFARFGAVFHVDRTQDRVGRPGSGSRPGQGCCLGVATHLQGRSRPGCDRPAVRKIGMRCLRGRIFRCRQVDRVKGFVFLVGAGLRWCRGVQADEDLQLCSIEAGDRSGALAGAGGLGRAGAERGLE